jgi:hypothetical protein
MRVRTSGFILVVVLVLVFDFAREFEDEGDDENEDEAFAYPLLIPPTPDGEPFR